MRRLLAALIPVVVTCAVTSGQTNQNTQVNPVQTQSTTLSAIGGGAGGYSDSASTSSAVALSEGGVAISEGGVGWSDSDSAATLYYAPTSISNYEARTQPLSTYPPYLPMFQHGGWGTMKAYFGTGPTTYDQVYQRTVDPANDIDVKQIKKILHSLSYSGPVEAVGGFFNSIGRLFGGVDKSHHGRGFDIANSVVRERRPEGKPLLVFIDSYIDPIKLEKEGYAYVGKISLEGSVKRNWDHVYNATIAEALPWDVDILLISGGMKGVTVGSTTSISAGGGYSQPDYSISLLPGKTKGITEGKGEAVLSATAYRFCPERLARVRPAQSLFDRIRREGVTMPGAQSQATPVVAPTATPTAATGTATTSPTVPAAARNDEESEVQARVAETHATPLQSQPQNTLSSPGITMSQKMYDTAFPQGVQNVNNVHIR